MNPRHPEAAEFYHPEQTALVLFKTSEARTRPTRVITTFGKSSWKLDDVIHLAHDQSGAYMGAYRVVGVHHFATHEMAGLVPDAKIKHQVLK